jgi:hypothetical protein
MLVRKSLAFVLVALMALPGYGNPAAVGIVQGSNDATLRGTNLIPGTTVYSGDVVQVGENGNAQIALGGNSQLVLAQNSMAELRHSSAKEPIQIDVQNGFARFRSSAASPVIALLGDATIRSANGDGIGAIKITGANSALISAEQGSLVVTPANTSTATTIPQGMVLTVTMQPDSPQQSGTAGDTTAKAGGMNQQGAGNGSSNAKAGGMNQQSGGNGVSGRKKILVGSLIVAATAAVAIWLEQNEGSNQPSLSPFKP